MSKVLRLAKPMSPVQSVITRYGSSSFCSTASAQPSMRSCSALDCSGVVTETSSTFVNWCWRIMPRVSRPAAPASARKQGVEAVKRSGSAASSRISSRTRLVSETSAVGMSHRSRPPSSLPSRVARNWSSRNFGSCAVPNIASSRTSSGGFTSV